MIMNKGLGRLYEPDARDRLYMASVRSAPPEIRRKLWFSDGWWGDQGSTSECVVYSLTHALNDGPSMYSLFPSKRPGVDTRELYCEAQKLDPWYGDCESHYYEGTSVRAGAKAMQKRNLIKEYNWFDSLESINNALLTLGPVVVGTTWQEEMYYPDEGFYIHPRGGIVGGHAYLLNGIDLDKGWYRIKNSWGRYWGNMGHAYITLEEFEALFKRYDSEALTLVR